MSLKSTLEKGIVQFNKCSVAIAAATTATKMSTKTTTTKEQYFEINILARANCVHVSVCSNRKIGGRNKRREKN